MISKLKRSQTKEKGGNQEIQPSQLVASEKIRLYVNVNIHHIVLNKENACVPFLFQNTSFFNCN